MKLLPPKALLPNCLTLQILIPYFAAHDVLLLLCRLLSETLTNPSTIILNSGADGVAQGFVKPAPPKTKEDIFYEGLSKVMSAVMANRDSWVFRDPVDEKSVPTYYDKIPNPICLAQMKEKVDKKEYKTLKDLESDFKLLVNNSETFNGPKSGFTAMAYGIWKHFRKSVQSKMNMSLEEPDEDKVFLFPPPKKWKKPSSSNNSHSLGGSPSIALQLNNSLTANAVDSAAGNS